MSSPPDAFADCFAAVGRLAGLAVDIFTPGRQAGFHVDRMVVRARRVTELLSATPPNTAAAGEAAQLLTRDIALGMATVSFRVIWN